MTISSDQLTSVFHLFRLRDSRSCLRRTPKVGRISYQGILLSRKIATSFLYWYVRTGPKILSNRFPSFDRKSRKYLELFVQPLALRTWDLLVYSMCIIFRFFSYQRYLDDLSVPPLFWSFPLSPLVLWYDLFLNFRLAFLSTRANDFCFSIFNVLSFLLVVSSLLSEQAAFLHLHVLHVLSFRDGFFSDLLRKISSIVK